MAVAARFLIDTSAATKMTNADVACRLAPFIGGGVVATTAVLDAEAFCSARDSAEYEQLRRDRRVAYEYLPTNDEHWREALEAQRGLARSGCHRSVSVDDLLTAVLAAAHGLTVLHYDAVFETAATVLRFDQRWVVPPGTI